MSLRSTPLKPWKRIRLPFQAVLSPYTVWGDNGWEEPQPKDQPVSPTPATPIPHGAGLLEKLPLEIAHQILLDLDLESLDAMRRASVTCRVIIDAFPPMQRLNSFASDTLKVLKMVHVRSQFSLRRVYAELCYPWCRFCNEFGYLVFIPTFTRCCGECHDTREELDLAPLELMASLFGITESDLAGVPFVDGMPGPYETIGSPEQRVRLIKTRDARNLAIKLHGEENWAFARYTLYPGITMNPRKWRYTGSTIFPYMNPRTKKVENGYYCNACTMFFNRIPKSIRTGPRAEYWYYWRNKSRIAYLDEEKDKHLAVCEPFRQGYLRMGSILTLATPAAPAQPIRLSPSPVEIPETRSKRAKVKRFFRRIRDFFRIHPG